MENTEADQCGQGLVHGCSGKARTANHVPDAQFWALSQSPTSQELVPMISNYK